MKPGATAVAARLASHGYAITRPVPGSKYPADYSFVLTRDGEAGTYVIEGDVEKTDGWHVTSATWSR